MRIRRTAVAVSAAVLGGLVLAGCGGDSDSDKGKDEPSPSQSASGGGGQDNAAKDAKTLGDEAIAAMDKLPAIKVTADGIDDEGKKMAGTGCARMSDKSVHMNITMNGNPLEIVTVDRAQYMQGDTQAWSALTGLKTPAAVAVFDSALAGGKWVKSDSEGDETVNFFDGKTDNLTKEAPTTFKGKQVVPLVQTDKDGKKKTYYIAAKGTPLIVGKADAKPGTPLDSESVFEKADSCDITVPPAAKTISAEELDRQLNAVAKS